MARPWKPESTLSYTYRFADGSEYTIRAGENGVTEKDIMLLHESDHQASIGDRYEDQQRDWKFQRAQTIFAQQGTLLEDSPMDRISDPKQDIWKLLFPEENAENLQAVTEVRCAMEKLTPAQIDLIFDLYGLQKAIIDIANAENVTEAAIRNRRNKIIQRLKKLLVDQEP